MKKIITLTLAATVVLAFAQTASARNPKKQASQQTAALAIKDSVINFGTIENGKPVTGSFVFTNTTSKPIAITGVSTGCGCTTPEYDPKPVMPGKITTIKVGYNAASTGSFYKTVAVSYSGGGTKNIYIQGEVLP